MTNHQPDRICRHCAHLEAGDGRDAGLCMNSRSENYYCSVLGTGSCLNWTRHNTPHGELKIWNEGRTK